jgi:Domain of unknown function (DUF3883)
MSDNHIIHDAEARDLDAQFSVERNNGLLNVIIESSGGGPSPRNRDYKQGLQLILERLATVDAVLVHIEVDSKTSVNMSAQERTIVLDGYPTRTLLSAVDDFEALRKKITGGAAKTARSPGAGGGGNPAKRLRLFLEFTNRPTPSVDDLLQLIGHGRSPATGRVLEYGHELERHSHTSALAAEDGPTPSLRSTRARIGQGFEGDQAVREAVEERAMVAAEQHYTAAKWTTRRREHDNVGYDILCTKGSEQLFVEVKGTRGDGSQVIITKKEATHAHEHSKQTELFILYEIQIANIEGTGKVRIISGWDPIATGELVPITYFWRLPPG